MIVATDYFTKWIEAEALSSIKEADSPISSVLRETQGDDQSVLRETQPVRSILRETQGRQDRHAVAHKQRPKGDAGLRPKRPSGDAARKKRPKGDAGCARNFLKGGLHAFCGKYPGSYPFPKGGRIDTQLPISSVLRETQGDDQGILRDVQNTPGAS
ncbi:unnamed protein product [Prunus armeniaca]